MSASLLATLSVVCPGCDEANPPASVVCAACGQALRATAAPTSTVMKAPAAGPPGMKSVPLPSPADVVPPRHGTENYVPIVHAPAVPPASATSIGVAASSPPANAPLRPASRPPPSRPPPPRLEAVASVAPSRPPAAAPETPASPSPEAHGAGPARNGGHTQTFVPAVPGSGDTRGLVATVARATRDAPPNARPSDSYDPLAYRPPKPVANVPSTPPPPTASTHGIAASLSAAASAAAAVRPAGVPTARVVVTVLGGGQDGQKFPVSLGTCGLGRSRGAILFPDDPSLDSHQATLFFRDGRVLVRDEGGTSGIFIRIHTPERLPPQSQFSVGQRLFRYLGSMRPMPTAPAPGKPIVYGAPIPAAEWVYGVEELLWGGRPGKVVLSGAPVLSVGQQGCDLNYPGDETLALRHCEITPGREAAILSDCSGGAGTYLRVPPGSEKILMPGDQLRVGRQVLRVEPLM